MNRIAATKRPFEPHLSAHGTDKQAGHPTDMRGGLSAASRILERIGADRIELVTVTGNRVSLQPANLREGEQIARMLGLNVPMDHRMFVPGYTLWSGEVDGLEVQVRAALRRPIRAVL